jgi:hypothetical protein
MNPNLTSALSEFTKKSEFSKSSLAAELSSKLPLHPSELSWITRARLRLECVTFWTWKYRGRR